MLIKCMKFLPPFAFINGEFSCKSFKDYSTKMLNIKYSNCILSFF